MPSFKCIASLFVVLTSLQTLSATPIAFQYPKVIPGLGFPSLASLNITAKDLYEMTITEPNHSQRDVLFPRTPNSGCGLDEQDYTSAIGVDLCYKYINKITTQDCSIAMGNLLSQATEICRSGDTRILARNYTGASAAITCQDIAHTVISIGNNCKRTTDGKTAGSDLVRGSSALKVHVVRYSGGAGGVKRSWF